MGSTLTALPTLSMRGTHGENQEENPEGYGFETISRNTHQKLAFLSINTTPNFCMEVIELGLSIKPTLCWKNYI
jgi:hypothetical protein